MTNIQFNDNRVEIKNIINEKCFNLLEGLSAEIESQVKKNTREDTGNTKRAWQHIVNETENEAYIGNTLENAVWEEFGTGEFAVNKDGRNTPWYVPVDGYLGKKPPTFNGKVVIVHGKNGKDFYKTNGKKPSRAFTKAFETVKPKAEKRAEEIFGGIGK